MISRKFFATLAAIALALGACESRKGVVAPYAPVEGDLVFQSLPHNPLIDAIEGATESPFSHCGILHRTDAGWVVVEAIGPVRETPLAEWIAQGRRKRFAAYRLDARYRTRIPAFIRAAQSYAGRPYDIHYDLDDEAIYCSELIYKGFERSTGEQLGKLQKLGDLKWQAHAQVIREIEGGKVPVDRVMITPRSVSEAPQLTKVFEQ
jgi:hypothetical protein